MLARNGEYNLHAAPTILTIVRLLYTPKATEHCSTILNRSQLTTKRTGTVAQPNHWRSSNAHSVHGSHVGAGAHLFQIAQSTVHPPSDSPNLSLSCPSTRRPLIPLSRRIRAQSSTWHMARISPRRPSSADEASSPSPSLMSSFLR